MSRLFLPLAFTAGTTYIMWFGEEMRFRFLLR
jgi:hypothetical protein